MNIGMIIYPGDKLEVVVRRADDGTNDGSIIIMRRPGHAYCIAKAPRYASDEEWKRNAKLIVDAIRTANPEGLRTRHLVEGTQHPLVGRPDKS